MAKRTLTTAKPPPKKPPVDIILDSGAYSAWKLGKPVDIDAYCDFLLANLDWIGHYVCLDVINPGNPEEAARASFENLLHMRKRGLDPMPVYHVGEDVSWLHRMLDLGCRHIGLSASSLVTRNKVDDWYAMAWSHLVTADGQPVVRAHAFGEGRYQSLRKFPWYSADSTSWVYAAQRNGQIQLSNGMKAAHRNDGRSVPGLQDVASLDEIEHEAFQEILREEGVSGKVFENRGGADSTVIRTYLTLLYYKSVQSKIRAMQPIRYIPHGMFAPPPSTLPPIEVTPFKFHMVVGGNPSAAATLAFAGYENTLVSYFYLMPFNRGAKKEDKGNYGRVRDFVYDPQGLCSTTTPFSKHYNVLLENILNGPSSW